MATPTGEEARAARAKLTGILVIAVLVVLVVILGVIWAGQQSATPGTGGGTSGGSGDTGGGGTGAGDGAVAAGPPAGGWDTAAEAALASRPMPQFPAVASLPQTLVSGGRPAIAVPTATRTNAAGVGEGFPPSAEGAIGQLAALDVVALADLNAATYNGAYRSISLLGAPDPSATPLGSQVEKIYNQVVVQGSNAAPISSRWQLAGAQVKGVTNGGRSVVVCVAGELQAVQANSTEAGTGDCQSMRFTGTDWRIAPGPVAALAPITWPGSAAFNRAGYHPTTGGPQ